MKRFSVLLLILSILLSVNVFAETPIVATVPQEFIKYDTVFNKTEFVEVAQSLSDNIFLEENGVDVNISSAYKLYDLKAYNIISEISSGKSMTELISDKYVWMIVTNKGQQITVINKDGKWSVAGYSDPPTENVASSVIVADTVVSTVNNSQMIGNAEPSAVYFVRAPMYYTNFAIVSVPGEDYMIPFGSRPDLTGLENGKLYSSKETVSALRTVFGEENLVNNNEIVENGGAGLNEIRTSTVDVDYEKPVIISLIMVATVLAIFWIVRYRKLRRS